MSCVKHTKPSVSMTNLRRSRRGLNRILVESMSHTRCQFRLQLKKREAQKKLVKKPQGLIVVAFMGNM